MNKLDLFLLTVFVFNAFAGYRVGLIKSVMNLVSWFLSLFCARYFVEFVQPFMVRFSADSTVQKILAFVVVSVAILALCLTVSYVLGKMLGTLKLTWLNRLAGGAFGFAKSALVVLIFIHIAGYWLANIDMWKYSSVINTLAPYADESYRMSSEISKQVAEKTTQHLQNLPKSQLEKSKSNNINDKQNGIIHKTSDEYSKKESQQTKNPFL